MTRSSAAQTASAQAGSAESVPPRATRLGPFDPHAPSPRPLERAPGPPTGSPAAGGEGPRPRRGRTRVVGIVGAVLAVLVVLGAAVLFWVSRPADPGLRPTSTVSLPAEARQCPATFADDRLARSARGNDVTSCEFAESVRRAYLSGQEDGEPATVTARSPVTGQDYVVSCSGSAPVRCAGGDNAVVLLY